MENRSSRLPYRVKGGKLEKEYLVLETPAGPKEIPWSSVKLLTLGIIESQLGMGEEHKSFLRSMIRSVVFGDKINEEPKVKSVQRTMLLDIFVEGEELPFRLDSAYINYRAFLGKVSHISAQNFKKLLALLALNSRECRLDHSLVNFLAPRMKIEKSFASLYDYELERENIKKNPGLQVPQCEIEIQEFWEEANEESAG